MSIKEKLSALAQTREATDAEAAERERDKELQPIRNTITRLDGEERLLRLIAWSLAMKSDEKTGKGMREYKTEATAEQGEKGKQLEGLIEENKEILSGMGIANKEDLLMHEEFGGEQEAVDYKASVEKMTGIGEADEELKGRLASLGVRLDEKSFSYESAGSAVSERLAVLREEVITLKLKTPEGHEAAIRLVAEGIDKNKIPQMEIIGDHRAEYTTIEIAGNPYSSYSYSSSSKKGLSARIYAPSREYGRETRKPEFDGWEQLKIPDGLPKIAEKYGDDVAREALQYAYGEKVAAIFDGREKRVGDLREDLSRYDYKKRENAAEKYSEFLRTGKSFCKAIKEQKQALIERGFKISRREDDFGMFNNLYYNADKLFYQDTERHDGGVSGDLSRGRYTLDEQRSEFSPRFDYSKIDICIQERVDQMNAVIAALGEGKTEEEILKGLGGRSGEIDLPGDSFYKRESELNFQEKESFWRDQKFKGVYDAQQYLDGEDAYLKKIRGQADQLLDLGIDAKLTEQALAASENKHELSTYPPDGGSSYKDPGERFRGEVKRIQDDRNGALTFVRELDRLSGFSMDEPVELRGGWIRIPRIQAEYDKLSEEIREERRKLQEQFNIGYESDIPRLIENRKSRIESLDRNKPKLFTGKWQKERDGLEEDIKSLEVFQRTISELVKRSSEKKVGIELPRVSTYKLGEELKRQTLSGSGRDVLQQCHAVAEKYTQLEMPLAVKELYEKYENLRKQLSPPKRS